MIKNDIILNWLSFINSKNNVYHYNSFFQKGLIENETFEAIIWFPYSFTLKPFMCGLIYKSNSAMTIILSFLYWAKNDECRNKQRHPGTIIKSHVYIYLVYVCHSGSLSGVLISSSIVFRLGQWRHSDKYVIFPYPISTVLFF